MSLLDTPKQTYIPISLFQLFSIGIGPSSSHTVGPMRAAKEFVDKLLDEGRLFKTDRVCVELFGSLAMTGKGHATDIAVMLGLQGKTPEGIDPSEVKPNSISTIKRKKLSLCGQHEISFDMSSDILFHKGKRLPYHANAMRLKAFDKEGRELLAEIFYSVGGGFIVNHENIFQHQLFSEETLTVKYPFRTCAELMEYCQKQDLMVYDIVMENEKTWRAVEEVRSGILEIWEVMKACVKRGCQEEGILPGGLNVKRRAADLYRKLQKSSNLSDDPSEVFDWISLYALAVNEENAAGGRVVTAPTNGAAGIIPAVLHYYEKFGSNFSEEGIIRFFLTSAAIGMLYKEGASLSAAEMGCQGEVGVACSMAAGGLAAALGATNEQIENAAEIGMEHNLGLTCDPIGGLVQVPCIQRNTKGAIFAINAARLAMHGDGDHVVSLDEVIMTMRKTGEDMHSIYKETSEGGLAIHVSVNLPEC